MATDKEKKKYLKKKIIRRRAKIVRNNFRGNHFLIEAFIWQSISTGSALIIALL